MAMGTDPVTIYDYMARLSRQLGFEGVEKGLCFGFAMQCMHYIMDPTLGREKLQAIIETICSPGFTLPKSEDPEALMYTPEPNGDPELQKARDVEIFLSLCNANQAPDRHVELFEEQVRHNYDLNLDRGARAILQPGSTSLTLNKKIFDAYTQEELQVFFKKIAKLGGQTQQAIGLLLVGKVDAAHAVSVIFDPTKSAETAWSIVDSLHQAIYENLSIDSVVTEVFNSYLTKFGSMVDELSLAADIFSVDALNSMLFSTHGLAEDVVNKNKHRLAQDTLQHAQYYYHDSGGKPVNAFDDAVSRKDFRTMIQMLTADVAPTNKIVSMLRLGSSTPQDVLKLLAYLLKHNLARARNNPEIFTAERIEKMLVAFIEKFSNPTLSCDNIIQMMRDAKAQPGKPLEEVFVEAKPDFFDIMNGRTGWHLLHNKSARAEAFYTRHIEAAEHKSDPSAASSP